ncbi:Oligopeptide-binding protein AppA precursor [compost metagenome]
MTRRRLLSLALIPCLAAAGCAEAPTRRANGDAIVVRAAQEPDSLNPYLTGMSSATDAASPIFSGLLRVNDQMRFEPDLALAVPTPENGGVVEEGAGMAVTYKLRPNVTWHDGKPFTSRDVAFTLALVTNPKAQVVDRNGYDLIHRVETPDDHTVKLHFKAVYAPYRQLFPAILPAHRLAKSLDVNRDPFNHAPIGTGPFKFHDWRSGDRLLYRKNAAYFRGEPGAKALEFKFIPDDNAAYMQLKNGAIDIYQTVSLSQRKVVKKLPGVSLFETPGLLWEHLSFNLDKPYFQDARVRRAIAHAIDKRILSDKVYDGLYQPAWSVQSPRSWAYSQDLEGVNGFDPARAKALLDEAGWRMGPDGVRHKDGLRLSVSFATTAGKKNRETAQLLIRHFLRQVGIEVRIDNHPGAILFGAYPHGFIKSGKFDMAMWAWDTGPDPDNLNTWHSSKLPPKGSNQTHYRNPEVDKLLEAATLTFREDERRPLYQKVSHLLAKDVPNVPLLYWTTLDAVNNRLTGFRPNPTSAGNLWNVADWKLEK